MLDFGIAKLADDGSGMATNTRTGVIMGTPAFMSPEQCRGSGSVNWRTDTYALGCILFHMLCGQPPFEAEGAGELIAQHIMSPPPQPSTLVPMSPPIEALILRMLAKNPDERATGKRDILTALEQLSPATGEYPAGADGSTVMAPHGYAGATPAPTMPISPATGPGAKREVTTLSAAAGTQTNPPPRRRGPLLPIAVGVGVVAVAGVVLTFALRGGGESGQSAQRPAVARPAVAPKLPETPAPKPEPPATPEPADTRPAVPASNKVTLQLESDPKGADVYRMPQGVRVGATPVHLEEPQADGEAVFLIKKRGYEDTQVTMRLDTNGVRDVSLERVHHSPRPKKPSQAKTPIATPPVGRTLNPFDK